MMKLLIHVFFLCLVVACQSQPGSGPAPKKSRLVGGPCEICHAIEGYDYAALRAVDTLPDFAGSAQKLKITGIVYQADGKTPAPGVVVYIYHTDEKGVYQNRSNANGPGSYTYHQGWVKTDENGQYTFYTFLPGTYPSRTEPRHIHPLIQEPDGKRYWIDAYFFDDDPLLNSEARKGQENRGGSGILRLRRQGDLLVGRRDIILGLNVPGYTPTTGQVLPSGKAVGEEVFSFTPYHVWGPDAGSKTCPVCKYGRYHGLLFFVGHNNQDWEETGRWLTYLENESAARQQYLKVYLIYENENAGEAEKQLRQLGEDLGLERVALTYVPSFADKKSEVDLMEINSKAANTIVLYRDSRIIDKFVNLSATNEHFELISSRLDATADDIFYLPAFQKH
ncbi:dioxygenase family protein [Flavilitoribacter nigricans]|uniref:Intradiol ring-cleavage dioxygenase n=1 Tax=Flavilitoribacter nigricans (strain ATCC 23147 / DSM 23189 / NBRC 102662 / NCIMB 1420 / SS-2) TaxID=1122177 RepID=A0A2D0NB79_FLAN2|nr:intradiol ring-cleavage dioxygenase [Flavilitoribacter nigricans]PHN05429.1 intradiol ring-cleavage dioxygenase [Flavilitoribacter nigricans DSM 23189 = NBRC 102662]